MSYGLGSARDYHVMVHYQHWLKFPVEKTGFWVQFRCIKLGKKPYNVCQQVLKLFYSRNMGSFTALRQTEIFLCCYFIFYGQSKGLGYNKIQIHFGRIYFSGLIRYKFWIATHCVLKLDTYKLEFFFFYNLTSTEHSMF